MIIKTLEELEPYRHLTVRDDVEPGRGALAMKAYQDLLVTEELVRMEYGANLSYYVAREHHIVGKSMNDLKEELGLERQVLSRLLDTLSIPRLSREEANKRNIERGIGIHGLSHEANVEIGRMAYKSGKGIHSLSHDMRVENGKVGGRSCYKSGKGIHSLSHDERVEIAKVAGRRSYEMFKGVHGLSHEERIEIGKVGGRNSYYSGKGLGSLTYEQRVAASKKGGKVGGRNSYYSGKGLGSLTYEQRVEIGKASGKTAGKVGGRKTFEEGLGIHYPGKRNDYLPTIHGRRVDVPYDAKSAYESNIYRLLAYLGFQIEHDVPVELKVDERRAEIFKSSETTFKIDFKAVSPKGKEYWFEICAHPYEVPDGLEKILMFNEQYPERKMVAVVGSHFDSTTFPVAVKSYKALEKVFAAAIHQSDRFAGWEKARYNLKTHPEVFGPRD